MPDSEVSDGSSYRSRVMSTASTFMDQTKALLDPAEHTREHKSIHIATVVFNLLQSSMGVSILSLAACMAWLGAGLGIIMFLVMGVATYFSVALILETAVILRNESSEPGPTGEQDDDDVELREDDDRFCSFEAMGERCYGKKGGILMKLCLVAVCLVAMTAFLVPLKAFVYLVLHNNFPWFRNLGANANDCLLVCLGCLIVPLSLMRNIGALWFTSLLGVVFVGAFTVVSVGYTIHYNITGQDPDCHDLDDSSSSGGGAAPAALFSGLLGDFADDFVDGLRFAAANDSSGDGGSDVSRAGHSFAWFRFRFTELVSAIGVISSSMICQITILPIFAELKIVDGDVGGAAKLLKATGYAMMVCTSMYLAASLSGYDLWLSMSPKPSSILACYKPDNALIIAVYAGMSFSLMFAFPLVLFSCRRSIKDLFWGEQKQLSFPEHVAVSLLIMTPVTVIAMVSTSLSTVIGIGGSFASPPLAFVIPCACYIKAFEIAHSPERLLVVTSSCSNLVGDVQNRPVVDVRQPVSNGTLNAEPENVLAPSARRVMLLISAKVILAGGLFIWLACIVGSIMNIV
ncbi:hypothetical protein DIPPA_32078 [Diplonema papillatum]|nr:hypothetical protein DIPPA_32078 [Diplonema papillatum]|eukprot:gene16941-25994_t